jgi:hypothetical protein
MEPSLLSHNRKTHFLSHGFNGPPDATPDHEGYSSASMLE